HYVPASRSRSLFTASASTLIYTPSLHDALPISFLLQNVADDAYRIFVENLPPDYYLRAATLGPENVLEKGLDIRHGQDLSRLELDRKSTRLNSRHGSSSYAVFCLKKHTQPSLTT